MASTFGLFDNFYDEGTLSADGHNWLVQADANDYIEKEFGAFYRSYPAQGGDALAYQRDGFLWNAVQAAGGTAKDFGEYNNFLKQPGTVPSWSQYYQDSQILEGKASGPLPVPLSQVYSYADIPSLNAIDDHQYPVFDLGIPDQYRADIWLQSFRQSEKTGDLPNLNMLWVPDDHTAGVGTGDPNPVAEVADNDLAVGRIIDAISHSQFWSTSAVFVVEDDTQNGVDHVDGHRGPLLIASPYAKRGIVDSTYYSQLNLVKTIEQILGVAPMNQEDRAAEPMFDAFTNTPDYTPYTVVPNIIPLTQGLTTSSSNAKAADQAVRPGLPGRNRGARRRARHLRAVGRLEPQRPVQRHPPAAGLGQSRAAQPARLVQRPRLEGAVPRGQEDTGTRAGARPQPSCRLPGGLTPASSFPEGPVRAGSRRLPARGPSLHDVAQSGGVPGLHPAAGISRPGGSLRGQPAPTGSALRPGAAFPERRSNARPPCPPRTRQVHAGSRRLPATASRMVATTKGAVLRR